MQHWTNNSRTGLKPKKQFETLQACEAEMRRLGLDVKQYTCYVCDVCGKWHYGHYRNRK